MTPSTRQFRRPEEAMAVYPIAVAVAAVVGACAIWWRLHRLQQATRRFRAAVRLTEAAHQRDMVAFRARIAAALADQEAAAHLLDEVAVLDAAEDIVNAELARTTRHNRRTEE